MGKAEVNLNLIYCHDPKQARDKEILANAEALKEFGLTLTEAQELTGTQSHRTLGLIMAANRILVSHFPFTSPLEQEEQEEWLQQIKSIRSNHRKAQVSMHNGMPVSLLSMELMLLEATFASMPLKDELSKMAQTTVKIVTGVTLSVLKMQLDASLFPALKEGVGHLGRWAGRTYAKRNLFQLMPVRHLDLGGATRSYSRAAETLQKLQGELAQPGVRWEALVSLAMALTNTIVGSATSSVLQLPAEVVLTICGRPEEGLFQLVRFGIEEQDRANTPRAICGLWADALASAVSSDHTGDLQVSHLDAPFLLIEQQVAEATQTLSKWLAAWSKASSEPHKKADKSELEQLRKALVDMLKDIVEFLTKPLKQLCKDICRVVSKLCSPNPDRHRAGGVARRLQKAAAEAFDSHCAQLLDDDNRANDSHSMLEELAVLECVLGTVCDNTTYKERLCSLMAKACNIPSEINRSHLSKNAPPPARTREREEGCLQLICKQVEEMHELLETAQHDAQSQLTSATKGSSINALEKFWSHEDDPQLPMVHAFASHLEGKNGKTSTARKLISILQRCAYRARALRCHFRAELIAEIGEIQASSQQQSELATLVANIKEIALNELRQLIEQAKEHCCDGYEEMVESLGVDDVLSCPLIEDAVKLTKQYIGSVAAQRKSERWRVREVAALCLHRVAIAIRQALSDAAKERAGSSDDAPTSTSVSPEVQAAFIQIQEKIEKEIEFRTYVEPCKRVQHILRSGAQVGACIFAFKSLRIEWITFGSRTSLTPNVTPALAPALAAIVIAAAYPQTTSIASYNGVSATPL
ncbi:hypothetical protein AB1Y20_016532 [Prymnesium parvum]|uniref:Uncharacterized protein n=1 Tax=Prymnesium parvum TaxID=97485 RepID=A0AB34ID13_PRYPA